MPANPVTRLRFVSLAEAISFLMLLLVAMPVKYGLGQEVGVQIMGPVHGILFIVYGLLTLDVCGRLTWTLRRTAIVLVAAVLPVAPFFVERWLRQFEPDLRLTAEDTARA